MTKKLVLIDGHSILNRAFYGLPDLTNAEGLHTNAVLGFLNILFKLQEDEKPDYLVVAFDVHAPTFRHKIYEAYKGTRKGMPEELREQVPLLKEVLTAMGVKQVEKAGLEADDILGTLAKKGEQEGMEVSLVSGDRDLLQIASTHIKIRIPKTKGGRTEIEDYYAADVQVKYQVTPLQFIDLKALMGDTADNIPGVPKVGEKTATELMVTYGSIENIYEHIDEISKKSIKESLAANRELADLSKVLATIEVHAEFPFTWEEAAVQDYLTKEAYVYFQRLAFKNLLKKFDTDKREEKEAENVSFKMLQDFNEVEAFWTKAAKCTPVAFKVLEQEGFFAVTFSLSATEHFFIPAEGFVTKEYLSEKIKMISAQVPVLVTFDVKKEYAFLETDTTERYFDVLIAAYLCNPLKNDYSIEDVAREYTDGFLTDYKQLFEKQSYVESFAADQTGFLQYACRLTAVLWRAYEPLNEKLKQLEMFELFKKMEMPLSLVLYEMEQEGILVRPEELKNYGDALTERITELETSIYDLAGERFNINSPKQLGEVLFSNMGLPGAKKTKSGYSTAADVLEKLAPEYQIVRDILEYRGLAKLKSTYADGLAVFIGDDNRIHTSFNQTITATGRISSTEPNLQNIPMRMELGRMIRKVFVPREGYFFMDADYSQIELRILAHMSGDEQLIRAYQRGQDIHRITASEVFHTPFDEVTDLQRRNAKAVNFGIVYGISSFGLSQDLSISRKEAAAYIDQYFATYPGVKVFLDNCVEQAKKTGYSVTMFGRKRPVPELSSSNFMQRSFGERIAMNSPIQGTAADIMKIAMIRVQAGLKAANCKSRLILQIHDELLIETAPDEVEQVREILSREMKQAADLAVSLEIDLHTGDTWYDAK
ncbi:MAG: DNA polymerase I [Lachnospiraceae bacterium]|nr:DNA polymerase I [Lachnospiraceae bacterium]